MVFLLYNLQLMLSFTSQFLTISIETLDTKSSFPLRLRTSLVDVNRSAENCELHIASICMLILDATSLLCSSSSFGKNTVICPILKTMPLFPLKRFARSIDSVRSHLYHSSINRFLLSFIHYLIS